MWHDRRAASHNLCYLLVKAAGDEILLLLLGRRVPSAHPVTHSGHTQPGHQQGKSAHPKKKKRVVLRRSGSFVISPDTEDHAAASGAGQRRAQGFSHCYRLRQKRRDQLNQNTVGHGGGVEVDCQHRQAEQM